MIGPSASSQVSKHCIVSEFWNKSYDIKRKIISNKLFVHVCSFLVVFSWWWVWKEQVGRGEEDQDYLPWILWLHFASDKQASPPGWMNLPASEVVWA